LIDNVSQKRFRVYFGNIPEWRKDEILFEIVNKGINEGAIVDESYLPEFLARENLTLK